jgi:hypothetical protein
LPRYANFGCDTLHIPHGRTTSGEIPFPDVKRFTGRGWETRLLSCHERSRSRDLGSGMNPEPLSPKEKAMRVISLLRIAALSAVLAVPLVTGPAAFASDDDSLIETKHQSTPPPDDPDQYCDTVSAVSHPWMMRSDD